MFNTHFGVRQMIYCKAGKLPEGMGKAVFYHSVFSLYIILTVEVFSFTRMILQLHII